MKKILLILVCSLSLIGPAKAQKFLFFDGDDSAESPAAGIPDSRFTLDFRFAPTDELSAESPRMFLFSAENKAGDELKCIFNQEKDGRLGFYLRIAGKHYTVIGTKTNWEKDKWVHLTLIAEKNSYVLYINGLNDGSVHPLEQPSNNLDRLVLGSDSGKSGDFFRGKLAEFRCWNFPMDRNLIKDVLQQSLHRQGDLVYGSDNRPLVGNIPWSNLLIYYNFQDRRQIITNKAGNYGDAFLGHSLAPESSDPAFGSGKSALEQPKTTPAELPVSEVKNGLPKPVNEEFTEAESPKSRHRKPSALLPYDPDLYAVLDRYEILAGRSLPADFFSGNRPYERRQVVELTNALLAGGEKPGPVDADLLAYLRNDNPEFADSLSDGPGKGFLKTFYKYRSDFVRYKAKYLEMQLDPVLYLEAGNESGDANRPFINSRGLEVRGTIADRLTFYAYATDNQVTFPTNVRQFTDKNLAVPGQGFWKKSGQGVDFLVSRGYIAFQLLPPVSVQFGYDKNAFGTGYRSLFLSDFSSDYTFLKINTKVGKFNYTNLFTQFTADVFSSGGELLGNQVFPKKYGVFHRLAYKPLPNLELGFFESVIFARRDNNKNDTFEWAYLNPLIFYRAVEQQLGSADNALVGLDWKWNIMNRFQFYGQIAVDELVISEVRSGKGWWGNKQAVQLGLKYTDVGGLPGLDLQLEYNAIRPYMYSHFNDESLSNYANYRQALAHPLGANFHEAIGVLRYRPIPKLCVTAEVFYAKTGEDAPGTNFGSNILLDNTSRQSDYDNKIGQGTPVTIFYAELSASYRIWHNLFLESRFSSRNYQSETAANNLKTVVGSLGIRLNAPRRQRNF